MMDRHQDGAERSQAFRMVLRNSRPLRVVFSKDYGNRWRHAYILRMGQHKLNVKYYAAIRTGHYPPGNVRARL
jgi:hypothetical protein